MIRERLGMLFLSFVSFIFRIKDEELTKEEKDRLMREYYAKQWSKGFKNSIVASYNIEGVNNMEKFEYLDELNFQVYYEKNNLNESLLYKLLHENLNSLQRKRNIPNIAYYGLSKNMLVGKDLNIHNIDNMIAESDIEYIYRLLSEDKYKSSQEIDFIINTMGGDVYAVTEIISLLHKRFKKVNLIVPRMANSAGTILACASHEIIVLDKSTFSTITPLWNGMDTYSIKRTPLFEHIVAYIKDEKYRKLYTINPRQKALEVERYTYKLYKYFLNTYGINDSSKLRKYFKVKKAMKYLNNFTTYYSHEMPLSPAKLKELGLNIVYAEDEEMKLIEEFDFLSREIFIRLKLSKLYINSNIRFTRTYD